MDLHILCLCLLCTEMKRKNLERWEIHITISHLPAETIFNLSRGATTGFDELRALVTEDELHSMKSMLSMGTDVDASAD